MKKRDYHLHDITFSHNHEPQDLLDDEDNEDDEDEDDEIDVNGRKKKKDKKLVFLSRSVLQKIRERPMTTGT
jgi:hypothetical protein